MSAIDRELRDILDAGEQFSIKNFLNPLKRQMLIKLKIWFTCANKGICDLLHYRRPIRPLNIIANFDPIPLPVFKVEFNLIFAHDT